MDYLSLCLICRDENDYLPEWLDYHILMGVDRFYIYDNESQVSLRETLKDYIKRGWVVVVDIPGKAMQLYAYDHCLQIFGANTFWMGFIDTDEFLVPKTNQNLKELLKAYEQYGGLAISSLFFGSSGHTIRPTGGQIAAYTYHPQPTIKEYELVKSIVQPGSVLMPNSPHDFIYKEGVWCVNEGFLRVDYQRFPSHTEKIQLNHYYCRSESEIDLKLRRGNSQSVAWARQRFETVNQLASYEDKNILLSLKVLFQKSGFNTDGLVDLQAANLLEKMAGLACQRKSVPLGMIPPREAQGFRSEVSVWLEIKKQWELAKARRDQKQILQLDLDMLRLYPHHVHTLVVLAIDYLGLNELAAAWQFLTRAWQLAPNNNYNVLCGMALYFLKLDNFSMAENTCRLILEMAPHDMVVLGLLTQSLIGQGSYEEAIKVGVPLLELAGTPAWELSDQMGGIIVKNMADYLLEKKDYAGAVRVWEAGVKCQPGDVNALLELSRCLILANDKTGARRQLAQAQAIVPQNEDVLTMLNQVALSPVLHRPSSAVRRQKKRI